MFLKSERSDQGSIIVLFCILLVFVIGGISYSFYIGQQIQQKIELQNAADLGVHAVGNHASQGLNMISANNLALGASLHIVAAAPIMATYASYAKALTSDWTDFIRDFIDLSTVPMASLLGGANRYQREIWNKIGPFVGLYMNVGVGLTRFNRILADYWLVPAPLRAVEMTRLNHPGAIALAFQERMVASYKQQEQLSESEQSNRLVMKFTGVKQIDPSTSVCQSIKASESIRRDKKYDNFWSWLLGPISTLGTGADVGATLVKRVLDLLNKLPVTITFVGKCGYGYKSPILTILQDVSKLLTSKLSLARLVQGFNTGQYVTDVNFSEDVIGNVGIECKGPVAAKKAVYRKVNGFNATVDNTMSEKVAYAKMLKGMVDEVKRAPTKPNIKDYTCKKIPVLKRYFFRRKAFNDQASCDKFAKGQYHHDFDYWRRYRSPYHCKQNGRILHDHLPHVKDGVRMCINLREFDPHCPLISYMQKVDLSITVLGKKIGICGGLQDRLEDWKDKCKTWFDDHGNSPRDGELQVIDYGSQTREYVDGSFVNRFFGGKPDRDADELGFLVVDRSRKIQFLTSVSFANVVARPLQINGDLSACPEEFKTTYQGETRCDIRSIHGFNKLTKDFVDDKVKTDQFNQEVSVMMGGMRQMFKKNTGHLRGTWSRSQWSIGFSRLRNKRFPSSQTSSQLFWPSWYTVVEYDNRGFFTGMMESLLPAPISQQLTPVLSSIRSG